MQKSDMLRVLSTQNPESAKLKNADLEAATIMDEFRLEGQACIELNDLLKVTGLCDSGGAAKTAIAEGRVTVDGTVELRRRCKVRPGQVVGFDGRTIVVK